MREKKADAGGSVENLKTFLDDVRIDAEPVELETVDVATVEQQSGDASLVLMPFQIKGDRSLDPFGEPVENIIDRLPSVAMVLAAEDIDLEAEPEEGKAGEMASVLDQLADAEKKAQKAEKEAEMASLALDEKLAQLSEVEKLKAASSRFKQCVAQCLMPRLRSNRPPKRQPRQRSRSGRRRRRQPTPGQNCRMNCYRI